MLAQDTYKKKNRVKEPQGINKMEAIEHLYVDLPTQTYNLQEQDISKVLGFKVTVASSSTERISAINSSPLLTKSVQNFHPFVTLKTVCSQ